MPSGFPGIERDRYNHFTLTNHKLASGIVEDLTVKDLLMMGKLNYLESNSIELLGGAVKAPEINVTNHPLVKQIMNEARKETAFRMYEQFLSVYMSPFVNGDIDNRLGKVMALKSLKSKSIYTDFWGRMYTRSAYSHAYDVAENVSSPSAKRRYHYTHLAYPPYAFNGKVDWVSFNVPFAPLKENTLVQSKTYNIESFQVNRDLLTYREPGFKAINDSIEYIQFLFEGVTGIVSTYLTEWDLSIYIQEGIIGSPTDAGNETYIPTISLLYRMKDDNPSLFRDDRAYAYGVINAAVSKYSTEKVWDVAAYPLSSFWMPRYDNFRDEMFTDLDTGTPPSFPSDKPFIEFFKQIKYTDAWNAAASGWNDWGMKTYKALYNIPGDGLSETDADYFMNPDEPITASRIMANDTNGDYISGKEDRRPTLNQAKCTKCWLCMTKCPKGCITALPIITPSGPLPLAPITGTLMMKLNRGGCDECMKCMEVCIPMKALENPETKRREKYKDGSTILNNISKASGASEPGKYPTTDDWVSKTGDSTLTYIMPIGSPVRNPPNYGGPHGKDLSPKSIPSSFEESSTIMRNAPRCNFTSLSSTQIVRDYFNGLNKFYKRPSLRQNPRITSDKEWNDYKKWKTVGHRLGINGDGFYSPPQEPAKDGHTISDGCLSIPAALHYLKQGIYEVRPYLTAYQKITDVCVILGEDHWRWFWWYSSRWYRPTGSYVFNPISNISQWSSYAYYGAVYSYVYYSYGWGNYNHYFGYSYYSYWRRHTVIYQYAKQMQFFYDVAWKYMHHSEPEVSWTIAPHKVYDYTYIPGSSWWGGLWGIIGRWWGVRYRAPYLIESYRIVNRLTCNSWIVSIRSFDGYAVVYTLDEMRVMDRMVRNHRGLSNDNKLFFIGPGANPDFIFRASVAVKEYRREVIRYHSHRSHRCHYHLYWMWFEYIDVQFKDYLETFVGLSRVEENRDDVWSVGLHLDDPNSSNHTLYQYMSNGTTISGHGIVSSWPGFEPELPVIPGNEIGFSNIIPGAKTIRLELMNVPKYAVSGFNTGPVLTSGGFVKYGVGNAVESYVQNGWMPSRVKMAFFKAFTSATFFPEGHENFARVSVVWPLRTLWAQINQQLAFLQLTEELLPLIELEGLQQMMQLIDPKTVKICMDDDLTKVAQKPDFNHWFREAYNALQDMEIKTQVQGDIITRRQTLVEIKSWLEEGGRLGRIALNWSYDELIKGYEYIGVMENFFLAKDTLVGFFHLYLQVLYEYRKYFISKRFNKNDGTFYILRHLEVLSLIAIKQLAMDIPPPLDQLAVNRKIYDVVAYDVQNTLKEKMLALVGETKPLAEDRIENVYIKVDYPLGVTNDVEAEEFIKNQEKLKLLGKPWLELTKTSLQPGMDGFNPRKQWAIKPFDGVYRLTSKEYYKNETNKQIASLADKVGKLSNPSKLTIQDIDSCLTTTIFWGDKKELTPIYRGNLVGVDPTLVMKYQTEVKAEDRNTYEMICFSQQAEDYWQVTLKGATVAYPRLEGYLNEVKLEQYDPEMPSVPPVMKALAPLYYRQLYPVTEEQGNLLPGVEKIPEIQTYLKEVIAGVDALDVDLDNIKMVNVEKEKNAKG